VIAAHPGYRVIVTMHAYMSSNGTRYTTSKYRMSYPHNTVQEVWDEFIKTHSQIFMVLCGHSSGAYHCVDMNNSGSKVHQIVSDYQSIPSDGSGSLGYGGGWFRLMEFDTDTGAIHVRTYSSLHNKYSNDPLFTDGSEYARYYAPFNYDSDGTGPLLESSNPKSSDFYIYMDLPNHSAGEHCYPWWKGQVHFHSLWSDGKEHPETITQLYKYAGYNFVVPTEHDSSIQIGSSRWNNVNEENYTGDAYDEYLRRFGSGWVETRTVSGQLQVRLKPLNEYGSLFEEPGKFLLMLGEELSPSKAHINAINVAAVIPYISRTTSRETILYNMSSIQQHGRNNQRIVIGTVNHPLSVPVLAAGDLNSTAVRFFEIYNQKEHTGIWDEALTERLRINEETGLLYGIATDDTHTYMSHPSLALDPSFNRGWVMVRADELTPQTILTAMYRGDFYASTGVMLDNLSVNSEGIYIDIDEQPGVTYTTQFIGALASGGSAAVLETDVGSKAEYQFTGQELYVRAEVTSTMPLPYLQTANEVTKAWIQPVRPAAGSGLQGYWKLDEQTNPSNNTTAEDSTENSYNGIYKGTTTGPVLGEASAMNGYGTAARFNGGYDHVMLDANSLIYPCTNGFTVAAWIKPDSFSGYSTIFGNQTRWSLFIYNNALHFNAGSIQDYYVMLYGFSPGQWMHVALVMNSNDDCLFYINGNCVGVITGTKGSANTTDSSPFCIGRKSSNPSVGGDPFIGLMDEVSFYDCALTDAQIKQLETVPILLNGDFELGSDPQLADYWTKDSPTTATYFLPSNGQYNDDGIVGRAASFKSVGTSYIQQMLRGIRAGSFNVFDVEFSFGYRNDGSNAGNIYPMRVSIWDVDSNAELAGENFYVSAPGVDSSKSPNVGPVEREKIALEIGSLSQPGHQIALRFADLYNAGGSGSAATAVIDRVSIEGFNRYDFNDDGKVNFRDFVSFAAGWFDCIDPADADCFHPWE
jgi:hypothetical protein